MIFTQNIRKDSYSTPPITRKTEYTFRKIPELRNATYNGTWMHGKMHGHGRIEWPSGEEIKLVGLYRLMANQPYFVIES